MGGRFFDWDSYLQRAEFQMLQGGGGRRRGYASQTGYNTRRRRAHSFIPEPELVESQNRFQGIDSASLCRARARICRSFMETRYRFSAWRAGTKPYLSYWPARLHRLAKSIPRNRFLGSINFYKYGFCICKHFKEPGNRFPAWRAGTTTLFFVPACQAT
jgi:hypothetical protein